MAHRVDTMVVASKNDLRTNVRAAPTINRSCSTCNLKKRKCDGNGVDPCSRCVGRGEGSTCIYGKRRPHKSRQRERLSAHAESVRKGRAAEALQATASYSETAANVIVQAQMRSLKRFRVSASPATGLVGMQENGFLSDFFGCVGFMPLTTTSNIREAMVKIMSSSRLMRPPDIPSASREAGRDSTDKSARMVYPEGAHWYNDFPTEPSKCIFWCAVGIGALLQGRPLQSVERYVQMAKAALANFAGPPTAEVVRAWTLFGYLHAFGGDLDNFQAYTQRASDFLDDSGGDLSDEGLPVGFAELVQHGETSKFFTGNIETSEMEMFCREEVLIPQTSEVVTQDELFRYLMKFLRSVEQMVYKQVSGYDPSASDSAFDSGGPAEGLSEPGLFPVDMRNGRRPLPAAIISATIETLRDHAVQMELLEHAASSMLVISKTAEGDPSDILRRLTYAVEIFERFPGMLRFMMGAHTSHMMMGALAEMGGAEAQDLYARLRKAYNQMRPVRSLPLPPMEEWQGACAYSDHYAHRSPEKLLDGDDAGGTSPRQRSQEDRNPVEDPMPSNEANRHYGAIASMTESKVLDENVVSTSTSGDSPDHEPMTSPVSSQDRVHMPVVEIGGCDGGDSLASSHESARLLKMPTPTPASSNAALSELDIATQDVAMSEEEIGRRADNACLSRSAGSEHRDPTCSLFSMKSGERQVEDDTEKALTTQDWLDVTHAMMDGL